MKSFLAACFFVLTLGAVAQDLPQYRTTLTTKPDFAIGPLRRVDGLIYFTRRLEGMPPCAGKNLYSVNPARPAVVTSEGSFECVIDVLALPGNKVGVRTWQEKRLKTWVRVANQWQPYFSNVESNEQVEADLRTCLSDLDKRLLDTSWLEHFPAANGRWQMCWAQGIGDTRVAGAYNVTDKIYRAKLLPEAEPTDLATAVLSQTGRYVYLADHRSTPRKVVRIDLQSQEPDRTVLESTGTVALTLRPAAGNDGVWIHTRALDSQSDSTLHFVDETEAKLIPVEAGLVDLSSFQVAPQGLLIGRENGRIESLSAVQPKNMATPAVPASRCQYQIRALETPHGQEWVFGFTEATGEFVSLVQTEPLGDNWRCEGKQLVLLPRQIRFHWQKGHLILATKPDALDPNVLDGPMESNVDWIEKEKNLLASVANRALSEQASPPSEVGTLLVFEEKTLIHARRPFPGNEFGKLVSPSSDKNGVSVAITAAGAEQPYRLRYSFIERLWQGEEK